MVRQLVPTIVNHWNLLNRRRTEHKQQLYNGLSNMWSAEKCSAGPDCICRTWKKDCLIKHLYAKSDRQTETETDRQTELLYRSQRTRQRRAKTYRSGQKWRDVHQDVWDWCHGHLARCACWHAILA